MEPTIATIEPHAADQCGDGITDGKRRALVAGWFSFEQAAAGAGDLLAKDLVCDWLEVAGLPYDVALAPPFTGGVDFTSVNPSDYSHVIFVCGPFYKSNLLQRFERCHRIGINLTMFEPVESWNPFTLLLERDSSTLARPDITFLSDAPKVPVVGIVLGGGENRSTPPARYELVNPVIDRLIASREIAAVSIDTRLDHRNNSGLKTPAEVESLIARMDLVLTTRLHGMVLALKNGVPAIAIDPVPRGHKIRRQAEALGWPVVFTVDDLSVQSLNEAFNFCLKQDARIKAAECSRNAVLATEALREQFLSAIRSSISKKEWGDGRRRGDWVPGQAKPNIPGQSSVRSRPHVWLTRLKDSLISTLTK